MIGASPLSYSTSSSKPDPKEGKAGVSLTRDKQFQARRAHIHPKLCKLETISDHKKKCKRWMTVPVQKCSRKSQSSPIMLFWGNDSFFHIV